LFVLNVDLIHKIFYFLGIICLPGNQMLYPHEFLTLRIATSVAFAAAFFIDESGLAALGAEITNLHAVLHRRDFHPGFSTVLRLFIIGQAR